MVSATSPSRLELGQALAAGTQLKDSAFFADQDRQVLSPAGPPRHDGPAGPDLDSACAPAVALQLEDGDGAGQISQEHPICRTGIAGGCDEAVRGNIRRQQRRPRLPVLAIGGADGLGEAVAAAMRLVADDVTPVVLEHCRHYVADKAPEGMLEALEPFLAPYAAGR